MITEPDNSTIDALVRILRKSRSILFITGAGVSAASGIPTYRGIGGLYDVDTTDDGVAIEEALSASMLAENPRFTGRYFPFCTDPRLSKLSTNVLAPSRRERPNG